MRLCNKLALNVITFLRSPTHMDRIHVCKSPRSNPWEWGTNPRHKSSPYCSRTHETEPLRQGRRGYLVEDSLNQIYWKTTSYHCRYSQLIWSSVLSHATTYGRRVSISINILRLINAHDGKLYLHGWCHVSSHLTALTHYLTL